MSLWSQTHESRPLHLRPSRSLGLVQNTLISASRVIIGLNEELSITCHVLETWCVLKTCKICVRIHTMMSVTWIERDDDTLKPSVGYTAVSTEAQSR